MISFPEPGAERNLTSENVIMAQNIISTQKEFGELFTELVQKIYMALYAKTKMFEELAENDKSDSNWTSYNKILERRLLKPNV